MRVFSIDLDGKPFIEPVNISRQFRVVFSTAMNYTENLGMLDLAIYNLSNNTNIQANQSIVFRAGYDDTSQAFQVIFQGRVTTVFKERDGANIVTRVLCRTGTVADRGSIDLTLGQNTTPTQALDAIGKTFGVPIEYQPEQFNGDNNAPHLRGFLLKGDIRHQLDSLGQQCGFTWAHDGTKVIIDKEGEKRTGIVQEVSLLTGLIGMPEATSDNTGVFVNVTTKLNPALRIGGLFNLKSQYATFNAGNMYLIPPQHGGNLDGEYKVMTICHEGDSWGEAWRTKVTGMKNG